MNSKAYYSKFESFALVDGPGVRSVLFLSGCPLRCLYCHNPETWTTNGASEITAEEAYKKLVRYRAYWKDNGGITISGGEPLVQIDFLIDLFTLAKENGISTCIDTAGSPFNSSDPLFMDKFNKLMNVTDLLLMDIKAPNNELHIKMTGKGNSNIVEMFRYLDNIHKPIWIRYVLVPGYTDDEDTLIQTRKFIDSLHNVEKVEVLPYHPFAIPKYDELGINYPLRDVNMPTKESVEHANNILVNK